MGPAPYDTKEDVRPGQVRDDIGARWPEDEGAPPTSGPQHEQTRPAGPDSMDDRISRVLLQKKGPDAVMLGVLAIAFVFGLIGLAVHFLWIVAIIVMALGLGFVIADNRRDRIELANRKSGKSGRGGP